MNSLLLMLITLAACVLTSAETVIAKPSVPLKYESLAWHPNKNIVKTSSVKPSREEQVLLQIYLDELNFGPGVIDGALGRFSNLALQSYYQAINTPGEKTPLAAIEHAFNHKNIPYVTVEVPSVAKKFINHKLPYKYSQLAEHSKANYRSYAEFMAERYHTSVKFLTTLNGKSSINNLTTGRDVIVPNVRPFYIEDLKSRRYNELETIKNNFAVVDTKTNVMKIFTREPLEEGTSTARLIAFFPITPGRKDQLKYGQWEIKNSLTFPTWRYDPKVLKGVGRSSDADAINVPPGPNNPVGVIWNGLTAKSVGIHGTNNPETIGRSSSSGCIRMANWDAVKIPNFLRPGCKVTIQ